MTNIKSTHIRIGAELTGLIRYPERWRVIRKCPTCKRIDLLGPWVSCVVCKEMGRAL